MINLIEQLKKCADSMDIKKSVKKIKKWKNTK